MKAQTLPLEKTGHFSKLFLDYLHQQPQLKFLYGQAPTPEGIGRQLAQKEFSPERRALLQRVLQQQYTGLQTGEAVEQHLEALTEPGTFTITTGHQLNIFTGPLYFIYKIAATIRACQELQQQYPQHRFVPLYWMASEDHDLAEINHFRLFGQTYTWQTEQTGPVGRFSTSGLAELSRELPEAVPLFEEAYSQEPTLAAATRRYVHSLFGQWGLLVLDADDAALKRSFMPVLKDELLQQKSHRLVQQASDQLQEMGYGAQIHPREINLFYMQDGLRERLVQEGEQWEVLNTDLRFSEQALLGELEKHPERFSPNVVLRPLYQEWILPNLAYIGGPAELAYWLQLKPLFDHYQTPFPLLLPRQFALVLNKALEQRRQKLNLEPAELFEDPHQLKSRLLQLWSGHEISLDEERQQLQQFFAALQEKAPASTKAFRAL
ncbi:bacillithiol biosynthesis cysteine-adding enzyme BshC [Cesiribacter andamanensis]|uniref:Bacillithiol biosynthesis BshC N-terminal Rossmann-like domain-containing protein n=1 Tax=Cesiribacter andamanensis AMV16 TaxID=1279009 RepID=M7N4G2_9BACT|nr:hypothetical protein ADICEAN_02697 [Cesiribacter andamanensis AMV16]